MPRPARAVVPDGPVQPVASTQRCYCWAFHLPVVHTLGDHVTASKRTER